MNSDIILIVILALGTLFINRETIPSKPRYSPKEDDAGERNH